RILGNEGIISLLLCLVVTVCREVDIKPSSVGKMVRMNSQLGLVDHSQLPCQQRLTKRIGKDFPPADLLGASLESWDVVCVADRAMIAVIGYRVSRPGCREVEGFAIGLREILLHRRFLRNRRTF